jgi:hypothetical protein
MCEALGSIPSVAKTKKQLIKTEEESHQVVLSCLVLIKLEASSE